MAVDLETLLDQAVGGDRNALAELMAAHGTVIRARLKIARKWRTVLEPDDVMQVTYLEAFLRIKSFVPRGPKSFPAWLTRMAENNLKDAIRELSRAKRPQPGRRVVTLAGAADFSNSTQRLALELVGATTATASRGAARAECEEALTQAVARLPEDYRTVVRLYDLQGLSVEETSQAMGRSKGAVFMLRARAHERLRELLGRSSQFFSGSA